MKVKLLASVTSANKPETIDTAASPFRTGSSAVPVTAPPFTAIVVPLKAISQSVSLAVLIPVLKSNFH